MVSPFERRPSNLPQGNPTPRSGTRSAQQGPGLLFPTDTSGGTLAPVEAPQAAQEGPGSLFVDKSTTGEPGRVQQVNNAEDGPGLLFGGNQEAANAIAGGIIPSAGGDGSGDVTNAQLTAERNARIAGDAALSERIDNLPSTPGVDSIGRVQRALAGIRLARGSESFQPQDDNGFWTTATFNVQDPMTVDTTRTFVYDADDNGVLTRDYYQGDWIDSFIEDNENFNALIKDWRYTDSAQGFAGGYSATGYYFGRIGTTGVLVLSFNLINGEITETEDPNNEWSVNSITGEITNTSSAYTINNVNGEIAEV